MRIVAVFHGQKVEGIADKPAEIAVNPTLTVAGMEKIQALVPKIRELGPYYGLYSSRLARALDTASVLALALDENIQTAKGLGQHANLDGGIKTYYPGHEGESFKQWQEQALNALHEIWERIGHEIGVTVRYDRNVLMVSHRPSIGGLVAAAKGISDEKGIESVVMDKSLTANGYVILHYDGDRLWMPEDLEKARDSAIG